MENQTPNSLPFIMHLAPGYYAGDARLFHLECSSLHKAGYRVQLVAHSRSKDDFQCTVEFHSLGSVDEETWRWQVLKRLWRSYRSYQEARHSEAALFHVHSPEFITWGLRLKRKLGRKVIFDCREDFVGYALQRPGIPDFLRRPLAFLIGRQLESAARNCDALIVADQGTGDRLKGHAHRILVLHNFPRLDLFPYREQREDEKSFDIVYHGTIPRYYMEVCLRIDDALLEHGTQVRWRLINKGTPDMDWFRAELARRGALQRFTLDGPVPHEQIASEVRKARIGIILLPNLPMFQSNIPRKLFEFMALGMPVVLSDLPPIRPFVSHGESAFLVSPDDYGAYAGAIARLLNDADLRQQMGAAGRRLVEQEYNWETESEKLLRLYSDLLSQ